LESINNLIRLLDEGKPIPTNPDGTFRDPVLEALISEYEGKPGDRRDTVYLNRRLRELAKHNQQRLKENEQRLRRLQNSR
jgi:hypothetical protein